jgi:hypothetical protein
MKFRIVTTEYIFTILSDSRLDFGLDTGFIDHFNTRFVTAFYYSAIFNLYTLQINRACRLVFSV